MIEGKTELKIDHYKPTMKGLVSLDHVDFRLGLISMAKADGEFTLLKYKNGRAFTINRYGHLRSDYPALNEAVKALEKAGVESAEILCELYAVDDRGKPLILPEFIRTAKGADRKLENLRLGVWDLISVNGKPVVQDYEWKLREMDSWFEGCKRVYVLPWIKPESRAELKKFWDVWVTEAGYEGLVIRCNGDIFKVKPVIDVDAVIIAINKVGSNGKPVKGFSEGLVRSVKLALMDKQERFVVIGDCVVPKPPIQKALWVLMDFKVQKEDRAVYVQPLVVVQVRFNSLFHGSRVRLLEFTDRGYVEAGEMTFWKMRNPRFIRFRTDKEVNVKDLRLDQVE